MEIKKSTWVIVALALFAGVQLGHFGKDAITTTAEKNPVNPAQTVQQVKEINDDQPAVVTELRRKFNPEGLARERLAKNEIARIRMRQLETQKKFKEREAERARQHEEFEARRADTISRRNW